MNTILLQPTDVLFFRDGRPMTGSFAGHGAAWPLPNVVNAAFHAALHRAALANVHSHRQGSRGIYAPGAIRDRKFGALVTAGPFPVRKGTASASWFFPCPRDLQEDTLQPCLLPANLEGVKASDWCNSSSLPTPLKYAVANRKPPSKHQKAKSWLSKEAFQRYLQASESDFLGAEAFVDSDIFDAEHTIGIAIDPGTGTTGQGDTSGKIYSAHYLRLREDWQLGVLARAEDKSFEHERHGNDLVRALLNGGKHRVVVGGQQRICTAEIPDSHETILPLPFGRTTEFHESAEGKVLLKWILLSPAIWPEIRDTGEDGNRILDADGETIRPHPGGWLPNWVSAENGAVLLRSRARKSRRDYSGPKARRVSEVDESIAANLVAALVPKPLVVTGWALSDEATGEKGGAQSTHLAVPAGAVYYFEADNEREAQKLSDALNWHGVETAPTTIKNRRSTLLGEKGFGLGVCGTWNFYEDVAGRLKNSSSPRQN